MHYMLVNLLHSHHDYMQHVMYVITYPLHAFEDANARSQCRTPAPARVSSSRHSPTQSLVRAQLGLPQVQPGPGPAVRRRAAAPAA